MSILCNLKRDNLYPIPNESLMIGIVQAKPSASEVAKPGLKTLPLSPILEIIDPKQYRIPSEIINQILWIPERYGTIEIEEYECTRRFSPENETDHALLAMKDGYVAGVFFGTIENLADGRRVFDARILGVSKHFANEKVGTKLMLAAMKKAQDLGLTSLTLWYYSSRADHRKEHAFGCERRVAFFAGLAQKFEIPSTSYEKDEYDEMHGYDYMVHRTYYLRTPDFTFNFEKAMGRFIRGS